MAERIDKNLIKNNNKNRVRLKVKEQPIVNRSIRINKLKKRDARMKAIVSFLAFLTIAFMAIFLIIKRINLSNTKFEYNRLQADIVSYQLQRDRLQNNLEEAIDLNTIQRYAIEDLDMVYNNN